VEIKIRPYSVELCSPEELVRMHVQVSIGSKVSDGLIYKDPGFVSFLKKQVLDSPDEHIFLLLNDRHPIGFCRLRLINDALHLNNIYIKDEFQGQGFGKVFLYKSINESLKRKPVNHLSLDVFLSNAAAYNWYLKIGMEVIKSSFWYSVVASGGSESAVNADVEYSHDSNGFMAVYHNQTRIGSLLNGNLILTSPDAIRFFDLDMLKGAFLKYNQKLENQKDYSFNQLEISVTMRGEMHKVLNALKQQ